MENQEKYVRVKSQHFENIFKKQRLILSEEEVEDLTTDLIEISIDTDEGKSNIENKFKVVQIIDFAVSVAEQLGMSGSELFSMLIQKEKFIKKP